MTTVNFGATARASDDPVKADLELRCDVHNCNAHLCDVQDGDNQLTLAGVTADHYTASHDGEGNSDAAETPSEMCERAYVKHADDCDICCLLSGEFCDAGYAIQHAMELLGGARDDTSTIKLHGTYARTDKRHVAKVSGILREEGIEHIQYDLYFEGSYLSFGTKTKAEFENLYPNVTGTKIEH